MYTAKNMSQENFWMPSSSKPVRTLKAAKAVYHRACEAVSYSERITRDSSLLIERSQSVLQKVKQKS